jgi:hypothetical protein
MSMTRPRARKVTTNVLVSKQLSILATEGGGASFLILCGREGEGVRVRVLCCLLLLLSVSGLDGGILMIAINEKEKASNPYIE